MNQNLELTNLLNCLENETKIKMFLDATHQNEAVAISLLNSMDIHEDDDLRLAIQNEFFQDYDYLDNKQINQSELKRYVEDLFVSDLIKVLPGLTNAKEFSSLEYDRGFAFLRAENFKKLLTTQVEPSFKKFWLHKLCQETNFENIELDDETLNILSHSFFNFNFYEQKKLLLNTNILKFIPQNFLTKMSSDQNELTIHASKLLVSTLNTEKETHNELITAIRTQLKQVQISKITKELELDYAINNPQISKLKTLRESFAFDLSEIPNRQGIANDIEFILKRTDGIDNLKEFLNYLIETNTFCVFFDDIEDTLIKNLDQLYYKGIVENEEILTKILYVSNYTNDPYDHISILQKIHQFIEKNKNEISEYFYPLQEDTFDDEINDEENGSLVLIEKISKSMEKSIIEHSLATPTKLSNRKIKL